MLIYLESQIKNLELTQKILKKYPNAQVLEIDHYKNIFDKKIGNYNLSDSLILAKSPQNVIIKAPDNYGYTKHSFFFRASLNCVFDCKYCYLQGAFKNNFPVIFVNYEYIASQIADKIQEYQEKYPDEEICFYASNYSDGLALDNLTEFHQYFLPFFNQFENVIMESRTKSSNIKTLLDCKKKYYSDGVNNIFPNFEIAFSLNPAEIINQYEKGAATLDKRIESINILLNQGFQVGLRFLPLLAVDEFEKKYLEFIKYIKQKIDFEKINSVFLGSLLYTKSDYKKMIKQYPQRDLLEKMEIGKDEFIRVDKKTRERLLNIFDDVISGKKVVQFC